MCMCMCMCVYVCVYVCLSVSLCLRIPVLILELVDRLFMFHNSLRHNLNKLGSLIFIDLCIVIYSYSTTNKMHLLSQIIYSCKTLYMFRTVFPLFIKSSKLRIQQRYMSNSCCYLPYTVAVYAVLSS
jgi:hypothetical protein